MEAWKGLPKRVKQVVVALLVISVCVVVGCIACPARAAEPCPIAKEGPTVAEQVRAEMAADCAKAMAKAEKKAAIYNPPEAEPFWSWSKLSLGPDLGTLDGNLAYGGGVGYEFHKQFSFEFSATHVEFDGRTVSFTGAEYRNWKPLTQHVDGQEGTLYLGHFRYSF